MELAIISLFLVDRPSINLKSIRFLDGGKPRDPEKLSCTSLRRCLGKLRFCLAVFRPPPKTVAFNSSAVVLGTREVSQGTYSSPDVACKPFGLQAGSSQHFCEGYHLTALLEIVARQSPNGLPRRASCWVLTHAEVDNSLSSFFLLFAQTLLEIFLVLSS